VDGGAGVLHERQTSFGLDGLEPERPVGSPSRKNDANRTGTCVGGERAEEAIDGKSGDGSFGSTQMENAAPYFHVRVGRQYIDVIAFDLLPIVHGQHRYLGGSTEQLGEEALVHGRQVLHDDVRHVVGLKAPDDRLQRFEPTCRSADAYDGKRGWLEADGHFADVLGRPVAVGGLVRERPVFDFGRADGRGRVRCCQVPRLGDSLSRFWLGRAFRLPVMLAH